MKKFLFKILLLSIIIFVTDKSIGCIFKFLQHHSKGGDTGRMEYIANNMNEDILIFGSSRAIHHYDPRIIADSLLESCYNCGRDGNGIIFSYGMYQLFKDRYTPKVIIYDIMDEYDLLKNDNEKYLDWLRYYYNKSEIDSIFITVNSNEKYKMISQMRRYNYKFLQIISDYIHPQQFDIKGYRPLDGTIKYEPKEINKESNEPIQYDDLKFKYFKSLIKECKRKGTKLIFMVSPKYKGNEKQSYEAIIQLAKNENVPFFYHYNDDEISSNKNYFEDSMHMNKYGAEKYTKKIIKEIKPYLNH